MGVGSQHHAETALSSERNPGTYRRGDCMGPRAGVDSYGEQTSHATTGVRTPTV